MYLTVWCKDSWISFNPKFSFQKTCSMSASSEYLISALPARRRRPTNVPRFISYHLVPVRPRISPTKVRRRLHIQELYAKRQLVCPTIVDRQVPTFVEQDSILL
ncbi:hypothetical protein AVEN_111339-1 [Araneus ventricosus]|uniref:Uncharacterized protein n=1 Tax=Araneus ventricosus TaxID=182803 RepID=A0A4Y2GIJ0_ARAVE|nr:hypothetical protein AVEN_111339-1 [Araneus ventricosus]